MDGVGPLVPAAGRGERLGRGDPEGAAPGGRRTAARARRAHPGLGSARSTSWSSLHRSGRAADVRALLADVVGAEIVVVEGGDERQESVRLALAALPPDVDVVLVHDAARALAPVELIEAVARRRPRRHRSGRPGDRGGRHRSSRSTPTARSIATVDRSTLRAIQTPQGFRRSVLAALHANAKPSAEPLTDDAGLAEARGHPCARHVRVGRGVQGDPPDRPAACRNRSGAT